VSKDICTTRRTSASQSLLRGYYILPSCLIKAAPLY